MLRIARERARHGEELLWLVPVAAATAAVLVMAEIVGSWHGFTTASGMRDYIGKTLALLPTLLALATLGLLVPPLLARSDSPLAAALKPLRARFGSPLLAIGAIGPLILMPAMFTGYGLLKVLMPVHAPFAWDDSFAAADRILFLGYQPWTWTHAVFGSLPATVFIDRMYTLWILFLSVAILSFALFAPRYDRARFFLCFTAGWVLLGVGGAWLGSSAGPCYSALIGASSAPEFAPLMAKLHAIQDSGAVHLDAVRWQGVLWDFHDARAYSFGMGISAMPSLHNAIAVLYALALFRVGRHIGTFACLYALIIFIGSIHLGWHYAVDGIVSTAAMLGIWKLSGLYLKRSGYEAAVLGGAADPHFEAPAPALA